MAEHFLLNAQSRNLAGKRAKKLRRDGIIPAVIYGQGENLSIQVDNLPLRRVLREAGMTSLIDIELDGDKRTVLAKAVQTHQTRGDLIHVDFYEVDMKTKLVVEASLVTRGIAAPVSEGLGSTSLTLYNVEIECLPDNLISEIEVDLSLIEMPEDMIHVRDLDVPSGVTILEDDDTVVARFEYLIAEEEEEEEEEDLLFADAADEVEVIGRGKSEEEEEGLEE
jgi:large subunit ribosomal protein L25